MPLKDLLTGYLPPGHGDWAQMIEELLGDEHDLAIVVHLAAALEAGALREPLRLREAEHDEAGHVYPAHLANGRHRLAAAVLTCTADLAVTWGPPTLEHVLSLRVRFDADCLAAACAAHPDCEGELLLLAAPLRSFPLGHPEQGEWAETDTMSVPCAAVLDLDYFVPAAGAGQVVSQVLARARGLGLVPLQVRGHLRSYDDFERACQCDEGPVSDDAPLLWTAP